jgi:CubicO group peptidase (beta-lactamase class C family)
MTRKTLLALVCLALATNAPGQEPKKRIVTVGGGPGGRAAETAGWPKVAVKAGMTDAERAASLDALLADLAKKDIFSGAVEVARAASPVYRRAFGLASREWNVPNRPDTLFNVGSIDKSFTQAAIQLLVKDGKISLDDAVSKVLPDYKGAGAGRITLRQLLNHTSGMGDIFNENWTKTPRARLRSLDDYRVLFEGEPLRFEPGAGREYSNAGYVLLGLVVEKASGKRYDAFTKERIFDPVGMKSTGFSESDAIVPNRATGYTRRGPGGPLDALHSNVHQLPGKPSSAGGGESTVDDLVLWGEALRRDALGLGRPQPEGGIGIAGGLPGSNAVLEVCPAGVTIAVMSNLDPPAAEYVGGEARKLWGCGGGD